MMCVATMRILLDTGNLRKDGSYGRDFSTQLAYNSMCWINA